jgi:hypothetical protein
MRHKEPAALIGLRNPHYVVERMRDAERPEFLLKAPQNPPLPQQTGALSVISVAVQH